MARNRTRTDDTVWGPLTKVQFKFAQWPEWGWSDQPNHSHYQIDSPLVKSESITDYPGPRTGSNKIHPVQHSKTVWEYSSVAPPGEIPGSDQYGNLGWFRYPQPVGSLSGGWNDYTARFGGNDFAVNNFFNRSLSTASSIIPTKVSIPNFLLEIDDIPKLLLNLRSLSKYGFNSVQSLRSNFFKQPISSGSSGRIRNVSDFTARTIKEGSSGYLAYNFGVRPLIQDVAAALGSLDRVRKRIAYLKRVQGKPVSFKRVSDPFPLPLYDNGVEFGGTTNVMKRTRPVKGTVQAACGWRAVHDLGKLPELDREIASLLADTGFNNPLSVIWEAIPFSFLLDYVTNIGNLISQWNLPSLTDSVTLTDGWSWTKTVMVADLEMRVLVPWTNSTWHTGTVCRVTQTEFQRSQGVPTNQGLQFNTVLTDSQAANIIALIAQALG